MCLLLWAAGGQLVWAGKGFRARRVAEAGCRMRQQVDAGCGSTGLPLPCSPLCIPVADATLPTIFRTQICTVLDQRTAEDDYAHRRTTALLSATLHSNLGSLASLSLKDPAAIGFTLQKPAEGELVVGQPAAAAAGEELAGDGQAAAAAWAAATTAAGGAADAAAAAAAAQGRPAPEQFQIPPQLRQRFVEVPCKLRLVALAALLRARLGAAPGSCKMVVFLATTDAVEYYHSGEVPQYGRGSVLVVIAVLSLR